MVPILRLIKPFHCCVTCITSLEEANEIKATRANDNIYKKYCYYIHLIGYWDVIWTKGVQLQLFTVGSNLTI